MRAGGQIIFQADRNASVAALLPISWERKGMLLVEIEKPEGEPLSAWFSELRDWLDANRCDPSVFTPGGRRIDRLIYRISFDSAAQAHHFCQRFARYSPTIRRATSFEKEQLRTMAVSRGPAPAAEEPARPAAAGHVMPEMRG